MIDLGEARPIDAAVTAFRAAITGERGVAEPARQGFWARLLGRKPEEEQPPPSCWLAWLTAGARVRTAVFDPLLVALGGCRRLLLAPDGELTRLPFEVLPQGEGCLIDDYHISYLATGRDALRLQAAPHGSPAKPLVLADPDFDLGRSTRRAPEERPRGRSSRDLDRAYRRFGALPGTRVEGEHIAALLGVEPWLEAEALERPLKAGRSPRVLHLATHGFFLENQPYDPEKMSGGLGRMLGPGLENPLLRSGLALAGINTWLAGGSPPAEAEDGLLTAEDVTGLDLLDTELVVLSGCDTGLGELRTGEGVFGLRRSFAIAGARTLVMSLWKVPDWQTQELMEDFYRRLLEGEPRAEALRQAQLALKAKDPDPRHWGAWICQGDPGPLPAQQP
jgi:CHAT domain-containing protein